MRTIGGFKILESGFQRNGVGGESFHYFKISWKDDDGKPMEGIATLTVEADEKGEYPEKFNGSCRVITPNDLNAHWRGDVFEGYIRERRKEWWKWS